MSSSPAVNRTWTKTGPGTLEIRENAVPEPGPDDAVLRTRLATVCGSDLHFLHDFPLPRGVEQVAMGHEAVGTVAALGERVRGFTVGDRVVASCVVGCGECANCLRGQLQTCLTLGRIPGISNALAGCQGDYYVVPRATINMATVPESLSDEQAILAGDVFSTGFSAVERAQLETGDSVAVFAQGPVGLCATAGARLHGVGLIIAVEGVPERADLARKLGANTVIDPEGADSASENSPVGAASTWRSRRWDARRPSAPRWRPPGWMALCPASGSTPPTAASMSPSSPASTSGASSPAYAPVAATGCGGCSPSPSMARPTCLPCLPTGCRSPAPTTPTNCSPTAATAQ